jgi:hypothetical protein
VGTLADRTRLIFNPLTGHAFGDTSHVSCNGYLATHL